VGYPISSGRHPKHSYPLVLHAELHVVSPADQVVIANVARYHRGAAPKRKHRNYGALERSLRDRVRRPSALLRVADGFDRGQTGAVNTLRVRWVRRAIRIAPTASDARASLRLECWGAHRKSALLAKVAGVPVEIVAPDGTVLSSRDTQNNAE